MGSKTARREMRLAEPARALPVLADAKLDRAVDIIDARYPGNPRDSIRRSISIMYDAMVRLFGERYLKTYPNPAGFRMAPEAVARETRTLARKRGGAVRYIDPREVSAIFEALVDAGVFVLIEPGNPAAANPRGRTPELAFATVAEATANEAAAPGAR